MLRLNHANPFHRLRRFTVAALSYAFVATMAIGQAHNQIPEERRGLDLEEKLNESLPMEAVFQNEAGEWVKLGSYFDGERPMILMLNYYRCPMLCGIQLNQVLDTLNDLEMTVGDEFDVLTVSFDASETPDLARLKKKNLIGAYERGDASDGWHFLVGPQASVDALLNSTGYKVRWLEDRQEWAHGTPLIFISPEGRITRYLYTMPYPPKDVRMALMEASEGRIGSTVEKFLLWCFHYDSTQGQYTADVMKLMRLCGAVMVVGLGTMLFLLWRRDVNLHGVPANASHEELAGGTARGGD